MTFSERLVSALLGMLFGALIGLACAWLLGMYSQRLGAGAFPVSFQKSALGGAAFFGIAGALFGASAGTLVGRAFAAMFAFERREEDGLPLWGEVLLVVLGVIGLLYAGITYTKRDEVLDAGPVQVEVRTRERIPIPPVVGAIALVGGVVLILKSPRRRRT